MMRTAALFTSVSLVIALAASGAPALDESDPPRPGAAGAGDRYFPLDGNGGYDVDRYDLNLDYHPATDRLRGLARITARATEDLSAFNLDLDGLAVRSVRVNHTAATWSRKGGELTVVPRHPLREDRVFSMRVRYAGTPEIIDDALGLSGFFHTDDGAIVAGQPHVASTWFPVNDHPSDKLRRTRSTSPPPEV